MLAAVAGCALFGRRGKLAFMSPADGRSALLSPHRATGWQLRTRRLEVPRRGLLMGIVNVTPDSFSDGGRFFDPQAAVDHALRLADEGADLLDIGGESTRPYAAGVTVEEELRRVVPVIERLAPRTTRPISVDTSKAAVARAAVEAGAEIVNDVTALGGDPDMLPLVLDCGAAVCAMHMQGTPQTMQDAPQYDDVVADIFAYLRDVRDRLMAAGVPREKICLDPGIGFGKTHQHNLTLLRHAGRFLELGCPVLVGHSRKGFIAKITGQPEADRDPGTVGVSLALARRGIQVQRVHHVRAVRDALALFEAAGGLDDEDGRG